MPTKELETVRKACIAANPSIMEIGFGCEVQFILEKIGIEKWIVGIELLNDNVLLIRQERFNNTLTISKKALLDEQNYNQTILGRPIRLADVLLAIRINDKPITEVWTVDMWGGFKLIHNDIKSARIENTQVKWNLLKDDLTLQSPETISFLYQLLK
jgi:hypothetical protein